MSGTTSAVSTGIEEGSAKSLTVESLHSGHVMAGTLTICWDPDSRRHAACWWWLPVAEVLAAQLFVCSLGTTCIRTFYSSLESDQICTQATGHHSPRTLHWRLFQRFIYLVLPCLECIEKAMRVLQHIILLPSSKRLPGNSFGRFPATTPSFLPCLTIPSLGTYSFGSLTGGMTQEYPYLYRHHVLLPSRHYL